MGLAPAAGGALAAGAFDGSYTGSQTETKNNNTGFCRNLTRDHVRVTVGGDVAKYQWGVPLEAPVAGDGSFMVRAPGLLIRGKANTILFQGTIKGGNLEADVGSVECGAHLSLKKI